MKKFIISLAAVVLMLLSCNQQQPEVEFGLSESQIEASTEGGTYSVTVTSATSWFVTIDSGNDWVTISPDKGEGPADVVTITTQPGKEYAMAYITFTSADMSAMLTVVRRGEGAGDGTIQLSQTKLETPAIGGQFEVEVTSEVKWMVDKDVSWLNVTPGVGKGNGKLSIDVAVTDNFAATTGKITVYEVGKKESGVVLEVERSGIAVAQFSVSETKKVIFAPGNLQYNAVQNTFRFAEHQYDYLGKSNEYIDQYYNGWIDLFGWGTSGYDDKYPYLCSEESEDYFYGSDIAGTDYDWGQYNAIEHEAYAGTEKGFWRTPTKDEVEYLMKQKIDNFEAGGVRVTDMNNESFLIILPDGLDLSNELTIAPNTLKDYTKEQLLYVQSQGAVILPLMSGFRSGTTFSNAEGGAYWTATLKKDFIRTAYIFYPGKGSILELVVSNGCAVRLVHDVE